MTRHEIGIVDVRNIVKAINKVYDYDFSNYALTSFKRRLEHLMSAYNLETPEQLIEMASNNQDDFLEQFLTDISIESTEMFRDPSLWIYLRDVFFPQQINDSKKYTIWFPAVVSGDELYSLAILLKESGFIDKTEIYASYRSDTILKNIKDGIFKPEKIETSIFNYNRFNGNGTLTDYLTVKEVPHKDTALIEHVNFIKQKNSFENSPENVNLIFFRNQMIYFNQVLQDKVLNVFSERLIKRGCLIIGHKESLNTYDADHNFVLLNDIERIYKKTT
jgi:chemotaxis protein methyltransferase CheR